MGVNARGLFVGLTNRPTGQRDPDHRSRGLLVMESLAEPSAPRVVERVKREVRERSYNPFHLLCADGEETWLLSLREEGLAMRRLEPGLQVLANRDPDDPADTKARRIRERLAHLDRGTSLEAVLDAFRGVLAEHSEEDPLEGVCVHRNGYGTRSSGLFALGDPERRFWYAEGPPCETKYRDLTPLLEGLWPGRRSEGEVIEANR
jgi:hypothetical protein